MPYEFRIDAEFGHAYAAEGKAAGLHTNTVNYRGFPIDTGTIVALKLLNPGNRLPAAVVSCNMYAEKQESILLGQAGAKALLKSGKRAIAVCVTALSNRYEVVDIDPRHDKLSSPKDDEWNRKVLELLGEGRLEDVSQVARESRTRRTPTRSSRRSGGWRVSSASTTASAATSTTTSPSGERAPRS